MVDGNMEQCPAAFMDHLREALFHQWALWQSTNRIGQRCLTYTLQSIADTQAQFLHIKRLGNVIIRTDFEPLQAINTLTLFCQENNGNLACVTISSHSPGNFISVNIGQTDVEDQ